MKSVNLKETEKYLPIGSIVLLKDSIVMYMIAGYMNKNEDGYVKDYILMPYPYGMISLEALRFCNHDEIEEIICVGYKDNDFENINKMLLNYVK